MMIVMVRDLKKTKTKEIRINIQWLLANASALKYLEKRDVKQRTGT